MDTCAGGTGVAERHSVVHVSVVVVGVVAVVKRTVHSDGDASQSIDHAAKGPEVDRGVAVEDEPGQPADGRLDQVSSAVLALELRLERPRSEAAGVVPNLEGRVD